jgi:hypothetical protein
MLLEESGAQTIKTIYENSKPDENESLKSLCGQTLEVIKKEYPNFVF